MREVVHAVRGIVRDLAVENLPGGLCREFNDLLDLLRQVFDFVVLGQTEIAQVGFRGLGIQTPRLLFRGEDRHVESGRRVQAPEHFEGPKVERELDLAFAFQFGPRLVGRRA